MKHTNDQPTGQLGLAANGSSGRWHVAVDETLDGKEWSLEIEGPQAYLVFQLRDAERIAEAVRFLKARPESNSTNGRARGGEGSLILGQFGSAPVSFIWDNEDFPRCFLTIGPAAQSTLRLSLEEEDVHMLCEALTQAMEGMPQAARE